VALEDRGYLARLFGGPRSAVVAVLLLGRALPLNRFREDLAVVEEAARTHHNPAVRRSLRITAAWIR
jgi:hypothetical protein